jgi:hypothetical protein
MISILKAQRDYLAAINSVIANLLLQTEQFIVVWNRDIPLAVHYVMNDYLGISTEGAIVGFESAASGAPGFDNSVF